MIILIIGLLLFLGVHSVRLFADQWRTVQRQRVGEPTWKGVYSLLSIAGFALIIWGFRIARATPLVLWQPPFWTRHIAAPLMLLAFILLVAAYVPGNRIKSTVGHPMTAAVKTWAVAHLIANGTLADVVLFGAFLAWAVAVFASARRRDRIAGTSYPVLGMGRDVLTVAIGIVAWVLFAWYGHAWLIGVSPLG